MDKLDRYFEEAKRENEIISLSEINGILSRKKYETRQAPHPLYNLLHRKELMYAAAAVFAVGVVSLVMVLSVERNLLLPRNSVFVPVEQQRVMHLVSAIISHPENSLITLSHFGSDTETPLIPMHMRTKFELPEDKLKLLGITLTSTEIKYEGNVTGKGYVSFLVKGIWSRSVTVKGKQKGVPEFTFYPWFMSDENGIQTVRYQLDNEDSLKMTNAFFASVVDQLIPVQVNRFGISKTIFWFSQTPELLHILESAAQVSGTDDVYTAERREDNPDIQLFPTITKGPVAITAKIFREQDLEISILTSSGEVLQVVNKPRLTTGEHSVELDLTEVKRGLYFIRIKSTPGLITMHRVFKE